METLWFCLVAVLIAGYVLLDGFDLGAGIVHLFAAKTSEERRAVLASIGPVWDGNEVWLLAGGGTLYFAFPGLYASSFQGFYLALMVVLWLLILRGISIEFRNHISSDLWASFWDVVFAGSSATLVIFYGAALGNVVRGVPLDAQGDFFLPLWTNLVVGPDSGNGTGIIDWYTLLVAVAAFATITLHGALWVALKTRGDLGHRARHIARLAWRFAVPLAIAISVASFAIQPHLAESFTERPWGIVLPVASAAGLFAIPYFVNRQRELAAFLASGVYLLCLLCSAAFGLFPNVLPSNTNPANSLTIHNVAAAPYGLTVGLYWFIPAFLLALGYSFFVYRHFAGKVELEPHA